MGAVARNLVLKWSEVKPRVRLTLVWLEQKIIIKNPVSTFASTCGGVGIC